MYLPSAVEYLANSNIYAEFWTNGWTNIGVADDWRWYDTHLTPL